MVRFSYGLPPVYPVSDTIELIKVADELGFHGCYLGDDLTLQDPWSLCAAAARETNSIRLGFSATHVYLREPTLIAQALATLDQISNGRVEAAVSIGGVAMLDAYGIDWRGGRPLARLREALLVMRTLLDDGELTHDGTFFRYRGLETMARPVQDHLPLLVAAMVGPRSFRLAGEVADGVHAAGCSKTYTEYVVEQVREGADRAGRDWRKLDLAAFCIAAVADDAAAARAAARALVLGWLPVLPTSLFERHGLDPDEVATIVQAIAEGDVSEALGLATDTLIDALCLAGTPEECAATIRTNLIEPGIDHVIVGIADPALVEGISGQQVDVPDVPTQLRLIHDRIFPALAGMVG